MMIFNLMTVSIDTVADGTVGQNALQALERALGILPVTSWLAIPLTLLIAFGLAAATGVFGLPITGIVMQIGRRTAVYVLKHLVNIVVDRLLEVMMVVLLAFLAGFSWLADVSAMLGRIFH